MERADVPYVPARQAGRSARSRSWSAERHSGRVPDAKIAETAKGAGYGSEVGAVPDCRGVVHVAGARAAAWELFGAEATVNRKKRNVENRRYEP